MATTEAPAPPAWHVVTREGVLEERHVEPALGLTSIEAGERLASYGPNRFAEAKAESRRHAFARQYRDPMQIVLLVATLAVVAGAEHGEGSELARTMGLTTFAPANLFFSFTARDRLRSVFSLDTFNDRTFLLASLLSVGAVVFATELRLFHRILDTVELTGNQWLICIGAGLTVVAACELWKLRLRHRGARAMR